MTGVWLDPDDREQMEALARARYDAFFSYRPNAFSALPRDEQDDQIDAVTAAVRSLLPPPPKVKPEEPTEWDSAVRTGDADEDVWVTYSVSHAIRGSWVWINRHGMVRRWDEMPDAVEIVRVGTGVES